MQRRKFMALAGGAAVGVLSGCTRSFMLEAPDDGGTADDGALRQDAAPLADAGAAPFVIGAAFTIRLNDVSCSGHDHACIAEAGAFADDAPILFNAPGSHTVAFRPSELMLLAAGAQLPFATVGPGPGHGHCGLAWRMDLVPMPSVERVDDCTVATPPGMPAASCSMH